MSAIAELSVFPVGAGESLSAAVAAAVAVIEQSGLAYASGPMGTCIEGDLEEVMAVATRCVALLAAEHPRVYATVKLDVRAGGGGRLEAKTASLREKLGRPTT